MSQLYNAITELRPDWHSTDPAMGAIKVVMTGSAADDELLRPHVYNATTKKLLEKRFKDPKDPLKLVIVRDMWLTGFDVPCLHTMYVDKPMRDHNLMQAIARVNRVFRDKQGGLVVDYIGIAAELRRALRNYTENRGKGQPTLDARRGAGQARGADGGGARAAPRIRLQRLSHPGARAYCCRLPTLSWNWRTARSVGPMPSWPSPRPSRFAARWTRLPPCARRSPFFRPLRR